MEVRGEDGILKINERMLTIFWTSLRGRLLASNGANIEVIPISKVFDVILVPASSVRKGCFQVRLLGHKGSLQPINMGLNMSNSLMRGEISHCVLFTEVHQPSFRKFEGEFTRLLQKQRNFKLPLAMEDDVNNHHSENQSYGT
jgi:hypothetical protein